MRIILLDLDCMRPDHFGSAGYHRNTTPFMDEIAKQSVMFHRAYCVDSPCVPGRTAMFSGRMAIHNGCLTHWGPGCEWVEASPEAPMISRYLRQHNYKTISFSNFADRHNAWWFAGTWSELHSFSLKRGNEVAEEVNAAVIPWLKNHAQEDNFFMHIHYWDPHRNYRMPGEWMKHFENEPPPGWPDQNAIDAQQDLTGPFTPSYMYPWARHDNMPEQMKTVDDWKQFVDGYDGAIRYMDHHIGQVMETLDQQGVLEDTAFIITADHGEGMGELGVYGDHTCASDVVNNIPMIVKWPGLTQQRDDHDNFIYNIDIAPTLCDLLDIPMPEKWDGESFAPHLKDPGHRGRDHAVLGHGLYSCQRAVRTKDKIFTRTYHPGLYDNLHPVMLHDLSQNRYQDQNIAADNPQEVKAMNAKLESWYDQYLRGANAPEDPMFKVVETGPWKYATLDHWSGVYKEAGRDDHLQRVLDQIETVTNFAGI